MMPSVMQSQHTVTQLVADCITNRWSICLSFNCQKRPVSLTGRVGQGCRDCGAGRSLGWASVEDLSRLSLMNMMASEATSLNAGGLVDTELTLPISHAEARSRPAHSFPRTLLLAVTDRRAYAVGR